MIPFSHLDRRPFPNRAKSRSSLTPIFVLATMFALEQSASALPVATAQAGLVLTIEGTVEVSRAGTTQWASASTNLSLGFGDSLRPGPHSRSTVRLSDLSVLRVNENTLLEIRSQSEGQGSILDLKSGSCYFFNRSKPASIQFRTPLISGAIRGTEFNLDRSEEHTSELQSRLHLVCRLLLEKKNTIRPDTTTPSVRRLSAPSPPASRTGAA